MEGHVKPILRAHPGRPAGYPPQLTPNVGLGHEGCQSDGSTGYEYEFDIVQHHCILVMAAKIWSWGMPFSDLGHVVRMMQISCLVGNLLT